MHFGSRGPYSVCLYIHSRSLDVSHAEQSNSTDHRLNPYHPQSWLLFSRRWVGHLRRTRAAVAALLAVKVRTCSFWISLLARARKQLMVLPLDSPLPPEAPGAVANGPTRKTQTWSTGTGWHQTNGPPLATLGKPPPGRDPKSRARSRDYLKQYVYSYSCHLITVQHVVRPIQMLARSLIFNITPSYEPITQSTSSQQLISPSFTTQYSLVRVCI